MKKIFLKTPGVFSLGNCQLIKKSFLVIMSLILIANVNAQNETAKSKRIGSVGSFYNTFGTSSSRLSSQEVSISTTDGVLKAVINVRKSDNGKEELIGNVVGIQSATVSMTFTNGNVDGFIVIPEKEQAFKYDTDAKGNAIVSTVDIHDVMCVDYDEVKSNKTSKMEAEFALPPATSSVYKLQSLQGAAAVAYLDVDGETVVGSRWAGGQTIVAQPMNLTENDVNTIWKVVAEDLRAFNINVTTDRAVYDAAPRNRRIMCILTTTNTAAPGAGGVAYLNSFSDTRDDPCWTFNTGAKTAGETSSHEIGHTFGLSHDGSPSGAYYSGHGSWAPIMGSSYQRPIGHWSIGEYANANNKEDDLAIIGGTRNGFGYKTDDVGNTNATAKPLVITANGAVVAANNAGIITTRTDLDVFSFTTNGGAVTLNVNPFELYPNLDVLLTLTNESGAVVATANPTNSMSAVLSTNLTAGRYFLSVDGTGNGNPLNTGYSDYSSIGGYNISGSIPVGLTNVPPAVSISAPVNNAVFNAPANITLSANASDADGSVSKVEFFNGTTLIATDLTAPYSFVWNNVAAGTYSVTAKATDDKGAVTTSATVTVRVNPVVVANVPPTVSISAPVNNAVFNAPANITLSANASDADGSVSKVEFFNGSTLIATDLTAPYSIVWNNVAAGTYSVTVKATDDKGAVTTSAAVTIQVNPVVVVNLPPTVTLTTSADSAVFTAPADITLSANAGDVDGSVSKVEFFNGTTLIATDLTAPYRVVWNNVAAGTYSVTAKATDDKGAVTTSAAVTVRINSVVGVNVPPVVSISAPANNAVFNAPANITLSANASDADGSVSKVEFFNGTTLISTDLTAPYSIVWNNVAAGTYSVTANATDDKGAVTTSTAVSIVVREPIPVCAIPTNLRVSNITTNSVLVEWTASANANSYVVWYRVLGTTTWANPSVNGTSYSINGLNANTQYEWTINAVCTSVNSGFFAKPYPTFKTNAIQTCTSPQYVENGGYVEGSIVKNGDTRYQCKPWPFSGWCNLAAWAYGPGAGTYWTDAWVSLGSCSQASDYVKPAIESILSVSDQPFSDETTIFINNGERINSLKVSDLNGKELNGSVQINQNEVKIGKDLPSGIYIVKIQTENRTLTTKVFKGH